MVALTQSYRVWGLEEEHTQPDANGLMIPLFQVSTVFKSIVFVCFPLSFIEI